MDSSLVNYNDSVIRTNAAVATMTDSIKTAIFVLSTLEKDKGSSDTPKREFRVVTGMSPSESHRSL